MTARIGWLLYACAIGALTIATFRAGGVNEALRAFAGGCFIAAAVVGIGQVARSV